MTSIVQTPRVGSLLPPAAAAKMQAIGQSRADAFALVQAMTSTIEALHRQRAQAEATAEALRIAEPPRKAELVEAEGTFAAVSRELAKAEAQREARARRRNNDATLLARLSSWINTLPAGTRLEMVDASPVDPVDVEKVPGALAEVRSAIRRVGADLQVIRSAPLAAAELKDLVKAYVDRMADRGRPTFRGVAGGEFVVDWHRPEGDRRDSLEILAWFDRDRLLARLDEEVDRQFPDTANGLDSKAKRKKIAELEAELLALEQIEETLVTRALAGGLDVQRRPQASPLAILGVRIAKKAKAAA